MPLHLPSFAPERWNHLNTSTSFFILLAVITSFTGGVVLGLLLLCGVGERGLITPEAITLVDKWLFFLMTLWGIEGGRFFAKRKTYQPGGSTDAPGSGGPPAPPAGAAG